MNDAATLYLCQVMHRRYRPVTYLFRYRVFSLLLDIDRLAELDRASRLFSVDRFNLFSFHCRDHLPRGESDLRGWVNRVLHDHGIDGSALRVRLLCMPRVLGWGFDPLSIWYCEDAQGQPVAAICEVRNTFGERHYYLLRPAAASWPLREAHAKEFHVSPFMDLRGRYAFVLGRPDDGLKVAIQLSDEDGPKLAATQLGRRRSLTTRALLGAFFRIPLQTGKVLGAIHWHALKIWLSGVPFHSKPKPPLEEVS